MFFSSVAWSFVQLPKKGNEEGKAKRADSYDEDGLQARRVRGNNYRPWAEANAERTCVAPVARTVAESMFETVEASVESNLLLKADWAAARQNEPPIIRKTG